MTGVGHGQASLPGVQSGRTIWKRTGGRRVWIIIVVLAVAFVAGLVANHWVRPFATSEVQGVKLELLVSPLLTLSVLLLAFLLVQVFASYKTVRDASSEEAGKVLAEFDIAGYLPTGVRSTAAVVGHLLLPGRGRDRMGPPGRAGGG